LGSGKRLLIEIAPSLIDLDKTGLALLLTDLQVALGYRDRKEAQASAATFQTIQRHARRTYDEVVGLLPRLTISDERADAIDFGVIQFYRPVSYCVMHARRQLSLLSIL
jgi:hypothetical protein